MHIVFISGSHREQSQSLRIASFLSKHVTGLGPGITADIVELKGNPLPLWTEDMWKPASALQLQWEPYAKRLCAADALVVVCPEWSGMAPAGLKNFFLYCSPKEIGHKPAMIVGVSASHGGAYPIDELRISSYKNTRMCYVPDHLIIRNCETIFVDTPSPSDEDAYMRERATYALKILIEYAKAFVAIRASGTTVDKKFPFGM